MTKAVWLRGSIKIEDVQRAVVLCALEGHTFKSSISSHPVATRTSVEEALSRAFKNATVTEITSAINKAIESGAISSKNRFLVLHS